MIIKSVSERLDIKLKDGRNLRQPLMSLLRPISIRGRRSSPALPPMRTDVMSRSTNCWRTLLLFHLLYSCFGVGASWSRGPQFGSTEETVTVQEGETAKLPCQVLHLKDRKVTWLRRRDLHILTTGHHTYSADERFQVVHEEGSDLWTLVVRYAQLRDAGIYECQVNTDPKFSKPVTLNVYGASQPISVSKTKVFVANNTASTKDGDLRVQIQGPRELFMEEGSSLTLTCLVTSLYGPSTLIYWYHDTQLMDYNSPRGGIKMQMNRERGETTSRLIVKNVKIDDSGMYSCVPSGSHPATVRVHVHEGENKAAVQQGGLDETSSSSTPNTFPLLYSLTFVVYICLYHTFTFNFHIKYFHLCSRSIIFLCFSSISSLVVFLCPSVLFPKCCRHFFSRASGEFFEALHRRRSGNLLYAYVSETFLIFAILTFTLISTFAS